MNKQKVKKVSGIVLNVLLYLFLALCVFAMVFTIFSKKDSDGAATIFGYQMRLVSTGSMEKSPETDVSDFKIKSIPKNSMIFVQTVPEDPAKAADWYADLKEGDVLTFRYVYSTQVTITHRIVHKEPTSDGKGYIIDLEGDNKSANSDQMEQQINTAEVNSMNYVIGKVTGQSRVLGFIMTLLKNPIAIVFIVIVPCFIIILLEVLKIVGVFTADKKKREQEKNEKKDSELEELRQRLAQLEKLTKTAEAAETDVKDDEKSEDNAENVKEDNKDEEKDTESDEGDAAEEKEAEAE